MKTYHFTEPKGLDALEAADLGDPVLGPEDVRVDMRAWSLNYRDLGVPMGGYPRNDKIVRDPPLVPLSDGAGEVVEVGSAVTEFAPGDKVASCFFRDWETGPVREAVLGSALGGGLDGTLAERVVLPQRGWVKAPAHMSHEEAACLPCAAVTAWQGLVAADLCAGQTVLALGTGGVSVLALQMAKVAGARVFITSSSDEKLERARKLGADATINYREHPDWERQVLELTDGVGVDQVIEVGGAGTLEKSILATRVGGTVSLIGILTGVEGAFSSIGAILNAVTLRGIFVGSREMFTAMNRALEVGHVAPPIDRTFSFDSIDEVKGAYEHLRGATHFGKVVIRRA